ncbi:MAG: sensor histidine kinase, partial [Erysipelotrichaceae bacterium]|nr:sensor histidine kinase [Erysipelotrichaceae bacterium]
DLEHLEQKRLLSDMITSPDFAEGMILYDILRQTNKYTNDEIAAYQKQQEEYRQYVETWIHEIKTPIAAAKMICDNADFAQKKAVANELRNIESFVEQALYYAKSTNVEKDYIIRKCNLLTLVKAAVKNHASQLILVHCTPSFNNLDHTVYTDHKWLEFILGQLIVNSIKYRQDPMQLAFSAEVKADHIILKIQDNGIGIPDQDLGKIFEKGFTGINGRKYGRSTGMGLYLCKVLAEKMNLKISVESQEKEGTLFKIFFPQNKFMLLEESR